MVNLKPCVCGSSEVKLNFIPECEFSEAEMFYVVCGNCFNSTNYYHEGGRQLAINEWNDGRWDGTETQAELEECIIHVLKHIKQLPSKKLIL